MVYVQSSYIETCLPLMMRRATRQFRIFFNVWTLQEKLHVVHEKFSKGPKSPIHKHNLTLPFFFIYIASLTFGRTHKHTPRNTNHISMRNCMRSSQVRMPQNQYKYDVTSSKNMPWFDDIKEWMKSFPIPCTIVVIKRWWGCIISTIVGWEIVPYTSCNCI